MQIRLIQAIDFAQWLTLWQGYQTFYQTDIPQEISEQTWQRFLDPQQPMHCAVAELHGELVGMVHYIFHRSCWTTGDYVYLQDLFTRPGQRGQGVGRALIEHVYAHAEQAGASRVYWLTHESNQQAMQLYDQLADKSGFIQYRKQMA
ncbi:GNAT family N-acetyltransferase [Neisseriaceae bacterium TC5R-5]|nr:GNAT family N-acetyltransferase [Neisseriaceae bacterium TC5R-5]